MSPFRRLLLKLSRLDRRVIFTVMAIAVALPLIVPVPFSAKPGLRTLQFDAALNEALKKERPLLIGVDFGPQSMAEMEPMLLAVLHRVFQAKKKVVFLTFQTEAAAPMRGYLAQLEKRYGLKYGTDYVFLGYASAFAYTIYGMGKSIGSFFHEDDRGNKLEVLPLMRDVKSLHDVSAVVNIASNAMPEFWIQYGVGPHGIDLLAGTTAVSATEYYPYLQSGQLKGILGGARAAAEYEQLMVQKKIMPRAADATRGLGSASLALLAILGLIAVGNLGFFLGQPKSKERS